VPTILLVEDDDMHRALICSALEGAGYQVQESRNGKEALRQYRLAPSDLVITDILMPEKDGLETIRALTLEFPDIAIIAMSEITDKLDYLRVARLFGADRTLRKPFLMDELLKMVQEELQRGPSPT
jgi:two-component system response regulator (stage 0 sporulation protein F)